MAKEKPGVMLYWETFDMIDRLKVEKLKPLLSAIRNFSQYGEAPDFKGDESLELVWPLIQQKIAADSERYEKIREARAEAGRRGGEARARNIKQIQANEANDTFDKQIKPTSTTTSTTDTTTNTETTTDNKGIRETTIDNGCSLDGSNPDPGIYNNPFYKRAVASGLIKEAIEGEDIF